MRNFWAQGGAVVIVWLLLTLLVSGCATVPPTPAGMVLMPKKELSEVMNSYIEQGVELKELREWKDKMFF